MIGAELGAAVKNVIAIAAGVIDGLGLGLNTRAALITRGLVEIRRLGLAMGAQPRTFTGLAGVGDLILTCTGDLSRNHTIGKQIGEGKKLSDLLAEMHMVAEGVKTDPLDAAKAAVATSFFAELGDVVALGIDEGEGGDALHAVGGGDEAVLVLPMDEILDFWRLAGHGSTRGEFPSKLLRYGTGKQGN